MVLYIPLAVSKTVRMEDTESATVGRSFAQTAMRCGVWFSLALWVGGFSLFAALVAPTAFRVLPQELAGRMVSPILEALHIYATGAGLALAALAQGLGRSLLLRVLPLALAGVCLYSQFGLTPRIAEIHDLAFAPEGNPAALLEWGELHSLSMTLFTAAWAGGLLLLVLHARADTPSRQSSRS